MSNKKDFLDTLIEGLESFIDDIEKQEAKKEKKSIFDVFKSSKKEEDKKDKKDSDYDSKVKFFNKYLFKDTTGGIMLVTDKVSIASTKEQIIVIKSLDEGYEEINNRLKSGRELSIEKYDGTQSEEELVEILSKAKAFAWNKSINKDKEIDNISNINVITSDVEVSKKQEFKYITSNHIVSDDDELTSNSMTRIDFLKNGFSSPFWIIY